MAGDIPMGAIEGNKQSGIAIENEHEVSPTKVIIHEHTLDEAVGATKIGKFQTILIVLSGLSIMGAGLENVNISYILPYAKSDLKLTIAEQGVLTSVSFLGIVSTSYLWGFLADTWGRQKVLCVAALSGFCFSFISGFATNTTTLIILRFLAGAFLAGSQAGGFSYISEFHTFKTAARAVACSSIMLSGLAIVLSLLAIVILPMGWTWHIFGMDFKPWRFFIVCSSFINLWNGVVFLFLPESPKFLLAINEKEKALQVLRRVYAFNTGQPEESYPIKSIKSDSIGGNNLASTKGFCNIMCLLWSQTKPIFLPPLLAHTWKLCYLIFAIFAIGHGTFMWFPDFLVQLQNYNGPPKILCSVVEPKPKLVQDDFEICQNVDNQNLPTYQILLGVGICFMASGMLTSSWMFVSTLTCFALNFFTNFGMIVTSFIIFLSCCSCANIVMAVAVNLFPTNFKGMATAFILMCGRIGGFAGSNLVGMLLTGMCTSIFYIEGGLLISCICVFLTIKTTEKSTQKPVPEPK
ncbi:synaptic vesicle glycoprotein 2C-like isoform X2 [Sitodiplosis mosellana]|uniref:synaptic vesicle glycoprotein 2C-like isoform X2 n=1 Tax=Sitodiplosis mosellana TaxID=263140 RepID=UPI002444D096|nr:synaptic vesicle glycoprotein 2C-like isoform X2 [Sitodiplosis mosellana]